MTCRYVPLDCKEPSMCTEAQYRLTFERLHGRGPSLSRLRYLMCYKKDIWNSKDVVVVEIFILVIVVKGGVITQCDPNNIKNPYWWLFLL